MKAAKRGDLPLCELLLSYGANANEINKENLTPIHLAAFENFTDVVELLTKHSDKEKIQQRSGRSPLVCCLEKGVTNYKTLEGILLRTLNKF